MAKLIEPEVEAAMIKRALAPDPWTYGEMCEIETQIMWEKSDGRTADKIMQRWRRKGWATFVRTGRAPLWSLTPAGRAMLSHEIAAAEEARYGQD